METKNEKGDLLSDKELRDAIMNLTVVWKKREGGYASVDLFFFL
jgi:hypothetical protein